MPPQGATAMLILNPRAAVTDRVLTGVTGLDEMLGGGFLPRSGNLIEGAPGTGKSTLGLQFIYNGITLYGEPGIVLTFEQFPQQYYRDARALGWDLEELERSGTLRVIMTSPEVGVSDLEAVGGRLETLVREMDARRILVDSISRLADIAADPRELRNLQYAFVNGLKREGLTAILTSEGPSLLGQGDRLLDSLAFMVDSYLLMRYVEMDSAVRRALLILKMRGSDHAKDIRQYEVTGQGVVIRSRFEGREGILSGSPHRMADSFMRAFVGR